ncbi:MAG: type II toxin-antitoxin system HicB family antitoxin [Spirochaetota bacterium]|nr:type II toxin-antitoxin system HicB family antitoxin [Spirochaetota bacterium]
MRYHFRVHHENNGYWADCVELEGCRSEGDTMEELQQNLQEALNLYLDEPVGSNILFPLPDRSLEDRKDIINIQVDPNIAFALLVRHYRIKNRMTQKEAQEALGLPNRTSYTRLERRGNPRLDTIEKIIKAFPDFPLHECFHG